MSERTIVVIEDEPAHARILEKSLRRQGMTQPLVSLGTAAKALDFLQAQGEFAGVERPPKLVLIVDLNLPGISGFDFLETLDQSPALSHIPRIIVSTSDEPEDMARSATLAHLAYLIKPLNYAELSEIIRRLDRPLH